MTNQLEALRSTPDQRPEKGSWAPGKYLNKCFKCKGHFLGDKRALTCAPCAYDDPPEDKP